MRDALDFYKTRLLPTYRDWINDRIREHKIRNSGTGADVRVGMFELSPGNRVAMFTGGGAALADRLVKGDDHGAYVLPDADSERPDLKGLSCRWETLAARHGHMMCMLIIHLSIGIPIYEKIPQCATDREARGIRHRRWFDGSAKGGSKGPGRWDENTAYRLRATTNGGS